MKKIRKRLGKYDKVPVNQVPQLLIPIAHKKKYEVVDLVTYTVSEDKYSQEGLLEYLRDKIRKDYPDAEFGNLMNAVRLKDKKLVMIYIDILQ